MVKATVDNGRLIEGYKLGQLPSSISGEAGKFLVVNQSEDGYILEEQGESIELSDLSDVNISSPMKTIKYSSIVRDRGKYINYLGRKTYQTENYTIRYYIDYSNKNEYNDYSKNEYIDVPPYYVFDFNSSPTWAHFIVDRDEFMIGLIHDRLFDKDCSVIIKDVDRLSEGFKKLQKYGYGMRYMVEKNQCEFLYNRKFADKLWYYGAKQEAREIERVNKDIKAFLGYLAIRLGGAKHFRK